MWVCTLYMTEVIVKLCDNLESEMELSSIQDVFISLLILFSKGITSDIELPLKRDTPITLAIPLMFQYGNCSSLCTPEHVTEYGFHLSSQQYNINNPGSVEMQAISSTCSLLSSPQVTYGPHIIKDSHSYDYHLAMCSSRHTSLVNLCYLCKNQVFGIHFSIDNPTFSMIVFLSGLDFNQSFAAFPLPLLEENPLSTWYHYSVLFGTTSPETDIKASVVIEGISIQTIYDNTNITLEIHTDVVAIRNGKYRIEIHKSNTQHFKSTFCAQEVLWMEPMVSQCTRDGDTKRLLSGTSITSNKPINVFTNEAKCNKSQDFSYEAQLIHQMPERREWGTRFILDTQQVRILPNDNIWMHSISALVSHNETNVSITYHYFNQKPPYTEQLYAHTDSEILQSTYSTTTLKAKISHIDVHATNPVLVTYDIYSVTKEQNNRLSYSVLLQPIEWYSNIQSVVLRHPDPNMEYKYHISVVVPKDMYDARKILISKGGVFCKPTQLQEYNGFNGQLYTSDDYIVFYLEPTNLEANLNETHLLVRHSHSEVALGVTVFAYSQGLHYGYSNGYSFNTDNLTVLECVESVSSKLQGLIIGCSSAVLVLVITVSAILCYCKRKRSKTVRRGFTQIQPTAEPDPDFYDYDAFLVFMNEDEWFVRHYIFEPLTRKGYKLLWHYDTTTHLFTVGNNVIDDTKEAMDISRKVVFVCTKYFTNADREVAFCKDEQARVKQRRIVPVVIEEEYASDHFKRYTQIRVKQRDLSEQEEFEFLTKLKHSLGPPKEQHSLRIQTPLNSIL